MNNTNNLLTAKHEQLIVLTTLITLFVPATATGGQYSIWEEIVPPLAGPPPHSHPDEEIFYVMDGSFEFILHDFTTPVSARTGDVIKVPSNALHTYKNVGSTAGKLLTFATAGKLEDYFRAVGKPVRSIQDIPDLTQVPDFTSLDVTDFLRLAPDYGVTFYLPEVVN